MPKLTGFFIILFYLGGMIMLAFIPHDIVSAESRCGGLIPGGSLQTVCLNTPLPGVQGGGELTEVNVTNIGDLIKTAFNFVYSAGAVIAVLSIAIGGLQYMATGITGKSQGMDRVQNAIFGLVLLFSGFLILRTINPQILTTGANLLDGIPTMPKVEGIKVTTTDFGGAAQQQLREDRIQTAQSYEEQTKKDSEANPNDPAKKRRAEEAAIASLAVSLGNGYTDTMKLPDSNVSLSDINRILESPYLTDNNEYAKVMNIFNTAEERIKRPTDPQVRLMLYKNAVAIKDSAIASLRWIEGARSAGNLTEDGTLDQKINTLRRIRDAAARQQQELAQLGLPSVKR